MHDLDAGIPHEDVYAAGSPALRWRSSSPIGSRGHAMALGSALARRGSGGSTACRSSRSQSEARFVACNASNRSVLGDRTAPPAVTHVKFKHCRCARPLSCQITTDQRRLWCGGQRAGRRRLRPRHAAGALLPAAARSRQHVGRAPGDCDREEPFRFANAVSRSVDTDTQLPGHLLRPDARTRAYIVLPHPAPSTRSGGGR
jgi:hypothetical protein